MPALRQGGDGQMTVGDKNVQNKRLELAGALRALAKVEGATSLIQDRIDKVDDELFACASAVGALVCIALLSAGVDPSCTAPDALEKLADIISAPGEEKVYR